MNDNWDDKTRRNPPETNADSTQQIPSTPQDIPRRGYERKRDATGQLRPPAPPPAYTNASDDYAPPRTGPRPGAPPPPRRGPAGRRARRDSGLYLPWWSLVILVLFVGGAAFGLLLLALNLSGAVLVDQTPQVVVVTGQLQATQPRANAGLPTAIATFQPTPVEPVNTAPPSATPVPGGCLLNEEVIVFNTGGVGLNLRDEPGGDVQFIAPEGERMLVITDAPVTFDGIVWCQVRSTAQRTLFGWAANEFLLPADTVEDE